MGALQLTPTRAGTIRRVIRRGSIYICGLCRTSHAQESRAQACIQGCWAGLLALDPVIVKARMVGVAFRCRFCARDYAKRQDAAVCAEDCKKHQLRLHEAEQSLTEQVDDAPARRAVKPAAKLKAVLAAAPAPQAKSHSKAKSAAAAPEPALPNPISADVTSVSTESGPSDSASASASAAASAAGSASKAAAKESEMLHGIGSGAYSKKKEEEVVHGVGTGSYSKKSEGDEDRGKSIDSGRKKLKTSEAFFRDGARYVCNGCQAKFFTRGEVEACFAGHK